MLTLSPQYVTTRNSASLYPFQVQSGVPSIGALVGVDHLAGGSAFAYDPWALYEMGIVTSTNMLVLGQIGKGKSAFVKTYLARESLFGRRVFVIDPKGEYAALADQIGLARIHLVPGGYGGTLNPLDAGPLGGTDPLELVHRRSAMISALAATGLHRDLDPEERSALDAAVRAATEQAQSRFDHTPQLSDIANTLLSPPAKLASKLAISKTNLALKIRDLALELQRMITGDLAGMFDGATTAEIDWDGPGLVIDISSLHNTDALAPVMVCAATWLSQALTRVTEQKSILVLDEAWSALRLTAVTRWLQSVAKLSRSYGLQLVIVAHRLSDFASQGDADSEAVRQAKGLIADVETRVIYGQADTESSALSEVLNLPSSEADLAMRLAPHRALWKIGRSTAVVEHIATARELQMSDTDQAMSDSILRGR